MKAQTMIIGILLGMSVMAVCGDTVRDQLLDNAWSNGAEGKIVFRVVDDEGNLVEGVRCAGWVRLFGIKEGGYSYHAETDTNGIVTIAGKCSESFSAFFTKDGYWCSDDEEMTFCGGCFNPKENDTNIEGDQELLYKIKNYKKERCESRQVPHVGI